MGLEGFGRVRAADIALRIEGAELVAVSSRSLAEARDCARHCGIQRAYRDEASLLHDPDIDALVISGPVEGRASLVARSAQASKPALVAPPIDLDPASVDRAILASFETGTLLQVGFHRRFDPRVLELRRALRDGSVGRLARIRIQRRLPANASSRLPRSAPMPFESLAHSLDLLRFISGEEVVELMASASRVRDDAQVGESNMLGPATRLATTVVTAALSGGALATIELIEGPGESQAERIEVEGSRGSLGKGGPILISPTPATKDRFTLPRPRFANREAQALLAETRSFVDALRWGRPVAVGPHEARESSILLESARRAIILGRSVRPDEVAAELPR
jgi:myo-inositol 2-dehydrogenase/D-chiro-inositol 1-dehydrogenase